MSVTDQDARGIPEPPFDDWGDGPAAYAPGERPTSPGDRTPPQDMAAEQSVLGSMLISKDAIADVTETIRGVDFYRPAHETIYDAIIDLYGRGEPVDMVTVAAELQRRGELQRIGGAPYLHTLSANVPIAANAGYYAEIVREKAILRRLVDAGTKIVQIGYAGEGQVDDIVDEAQAEVYKITDKRTSEDYAPLSDIMDGVLDEIEAICNREAGLYGVPTGFADLDDLTNGLHAGQMIIVAARPAMGKSTLALDFCRAASIHNNLTSAFFSLEMTRSEITMRLLSAEAKVPLNHIRNGNMNDDDWAKLARKMGEVSVGADVHRRLAEHDDDGDPGQGPPAQAAPRPAADGHRLHAADDARARRSSPASSRSRSSPARSSCWPRSSSIPIIALSQLNRGPEQRGDKRPMMSDLRESGSIEQDADMVILLHRDDVYEKESTRPGEADLIVAKHRNGPTRDITVAFQGHYSRFVDMAH